MALPKRPSLVDVVEEYFGESIGRLSSDSITQLPKDHCDDFVDKLDDFLKAAVGYDYPDDAVMMDSMSDPFIVAHDITRPRTTRRLKQVALHHPEVVIPMQPLWIDYRLEDDPVRARALLGSLLEWSRQNDALIRNHVIPICRHTSIYDLLPKDRVAELVRELSQACLSPEFADLRQEIIREEDAQTSEELSGHVEVWMQGVLMDAANAGSINGNLAFTCTPSGKAYEKVARAACRMERGGAEVLSNATLLHNLELPKIDDLADADFVAIRMQADDFDEFRSALSRVLRRTNASLSEGMPLQDAFADNLDEVRWRSELLRRETRDKSLKRFLWGGFQNITLGAVTSTTAAAVADLTGHAFRP